MKRFFLTIFLIQFLAYGEENSSASNKASMDSLRSEIRLIVEENKKKNQIFDSLLLVNSNNENMISNYSKIIDNLGSAYAPISTLVGVLGVFVGLLAIIAAAVIFRIEQKKDEQVNKIIENKHNEVMELVNAEKERHAKSNEATISFIKEQENRRDKAIQDYQDLLRKRLDDLKSEIQKKQDKDSPSIKKEIENIEERIAEAPLTFSQGTSAVAGTTGPAYGVYGFSPRYLCPNCGYRNPTYLRDLAGIKKKCDKCGLEF